MSGKEKQGASMSMDMKTKFMCLIIPIPNPVVGVATSYNKQAILQKYTYLLEIKIQQFFISKSARMK